MFEWIRSHSTLLWWMGAFSIVTFVGSFIVIPTLLARLPSDHFLHTHPRPGSWPARHPVLRWAGRTSKNILGGVLVLCGVAMLLLPGQGIITILIGLGLLDIPGKRGLELALLRRPMVSRVVNWIRAKAHRPPLRLPPARDEEDSQVRSRLPRRTGKEEPPRRP